MKKSTGKEMIKYKECFQNFYHYLIYYLLNNRSIVYDMVQWVKALSSKRDLQHSHGGKKLNLFKLFSGIHKHSMVHKQVK